MNDPTSYNNERDFGLEGRRRDVAPDIMISWNGNHCRDCSYNIGYCSKYNKK